MADIADVMRHAEGRARLEAAERHFYDLNRPHRCGHFSFTQRDEGDWDVVADQARGKATAWRTANPEGSTTMADGVEERAFTIRSQGDEVFVHDERWDPHRPFPRGSTRFRSVSVAMLWVIEELRRER